jgi:hypothetical protein
MATIKTPVQAVEWVCHAPTTIKDADGKVLAECTGQGQHSDDATAAAAEIARRVNAHDDLVAALRELMSFCEDSCVVRMVNGRELVYPTFQQARDALAKATGSQA